MKPVLCLSLFETKLLLVPPSLAFFASLLTVISLQDYLSRWLLLLNDSRLFFYSSSLLCIILSCYLNTQFSKAFSHYVISWYKAFWNTSWETLYEVNWIEFSLKVRGFQHLSLAKSAEFLAPMPGCNGHALQPSYELVFFLGKMKWQCQYLESKQETDQYFHLWWGWQNENIWGIFEVFNAHIEIMLFCRIYLHLVFVLNVYAGGICMCMSGKERGREGGNSRAWN